MVTPPAAAAADSVSASLAARGLLMSEPCPRWMCASTTPGMTRRPFRSTVASPASAPGAAMASMRPPAIPISASTVAPSGSTALPPLSTVSSTRATIAHPLLRRVLAYDCPASIRQYHRSQLPHDDISRRDHRRHRYRQHHLIHAARLESRDLARDFRVPAREGKARNDVVRDQAREISLAHFRAGGSRRPA